MNKKWLITGGALAAVVAIPAAAFQIERMQPLTRAEVQSKIRERFALLDTNKDGVITAAELGERREANQAERAARRAQLFVALDSDRNGQLSPAEFAAAPPPPAPAMAEDGPDDRGPGGPDGPRGDRGPRGDHGPRGMRGPEGGPRGDWLARADANQDGKLTLAEAAAPALARFDQADANKDGKVTRAERRALHEALREGFRG